MSEEKKLTPVSHLGEFGLINRLTQPFTIYHPSSIKGVGDDAAIIRHNNADIVVTTDLLAEGIHFDLTYTPLKHLGYKAVIVNLSDIAAMNAQARQITVSIAISSRFTVEALEEIYEGIRHACNIYKVDLVGGDTTSSKAGLIISITAIGEVEKDKAVVRSGAQPGHLICVSGDLGAAYLGLQLLEREKQVYLSDPNMKPQFGQNDYLLQRFLKPEARFDVIRFFREADITPTAMLDVSDGLSSDVMHICKQSSTGCRIYEAQVPISEQAYHTAIDLNIDPITCAMNGGEDYELLFTIDPEDETKIAGDEAISIIGEITESSEGCVLITKSGNSYPLVAQGWNHFS